MGSVVSLVRAKRSAEDIIDVVSEAFNLINFEPNASVKSVAIKPNLCYYWDSETGYTTDPRVVAGIIDYVRERCGKDADIKVVESDASAMRIKYAFPVQIFRNSGSPESRMIPQKHHCSGNNNPRLH